MTFLDWLLPVLVVAWTVWGVYDYRLLKQSLRDGDRSALIREYRITVAGEVAGGALALAAVGASILNAEGLGRVVNDSARSLVLGGLAGLAVGLIAQPLAARAHKQPVLVGDIAALIPRTAGEKAWYAAVSVSAGVGEELVFRGFFMRLLADFGLQGLALVAVSAVIFGFAHVYQGVGGVLVTTLMGALLGVVFLATGSLLVAMAVHALMDLRLLAMPTPADGGET